MIQRTSRHVLENSIMTTNRYICDNPPKVEHVCFGIFRFVRSPKREN